MKRTQASSSYPLKHLSPSSQQACKKNTQYERLRDKKVLKKYAPPDVILDDAQNQEMALAVSKIDELANDELQQIFQEADASDQQKTCTYSILCCLQS